MDGAVGRGWAGSVSHPGPASWTRVVDPRRGPASPAPGHRPRRRRRGARTADVEDRGWKVRSTVTVGGSTTPMPCSWMTAVVSPSASSRGRSSASSVAAEPPLSATRVPPGVSSGAHQTASRASRATARAVTHDAEIRPCRLLGPPPHDLDVAEPEVGDGPGQPLRAPEHRLDEGDGEVRPGDGQSESGQPGARPHIDDRRRLGERVGDDGTVEQVSVPQSRDLPGADEPVAHPGVGEQGGIPLGDLDAVPERDGCPGGRRRLVGHRLEASLRPRPPRRFT